MKREILTTTGLERCRLWTNVKEMRMEHGRLIEMGQIATIDQDGTRMEYKMALVIEFASVAEIKQAIDEGRCTFGWGDDPVPNACGEPGLTELGKD